LAKESKKVLTKKEYFAHNDFVENLTLSFKEVTYNTREVKLLN